MTENTKCNEIRDMFSPLLDGELIGEDSALLAGHLLECDPCRREFELWQKISETLKNEIVSEDPSADFCASIMGRLREEARPRRGLLHTWRGPAAAAAAAAMLFAGSWGVTVALKPEKPEIVAVSPEQPAESTVTGQGNGKKPEKTVQPEATDKVTTPDRPGDQLKAEQFKNSNEGIKPPAPTGTPKSGDQFKLLNDSSRDILSTILKLSVTNTKDAKNTALAITTRYGGSGQVLSTQKKGEGELVIIRVTVPRESERSLVAQLSGLGGIIDRVDESRNITDNYNQAQSRYNEIQARIDSGVAPADERSRLEAEASGLKRQIGSWNTESGAYIIILWLEH